MNQEQYVELCLRSNGVRGGESVNGLEVISVDPDGADVVLGGRRQRLSGDDVQAMHNMFQRIAYTIGFKSAEAKMR